MITTSVFSGHFIRSRPLSPGRVYGRRRIMTYANHQKRHQYNLSDRYLPLHDHSYLTSSLNVQISIPNLYLNHGEWVNFSMAFSFEKTRMAELRRGEISSKMNLHRWVPGIQTDGRTDRTNIPILCYAYFTCGWAI